MQSSISWRKLKPAAWKLHNEERDLSLSCAAIRVDPTASQRRNESSGRCAHFISPGFPLLLIVPAFAGELFCKG